MSKTKEQPPSRVRRRLLIFDVDRSTASIGSDEHIEATVGFKPRRVSFGTTEIRNTLQRLYVEREMKVPSQLFDGEYDIETVFAPNDKAKELGLIGIAIDTLSVAAEQEMTALKEEKGIKFLDSRTLPMFGLFRDTITRFCSVLKNLRGVVIVNMHTLTKQDSIGQSVAMPAVEGSAKEMLAKYFDVVLYTETRLNAEGHTEYLWRRSPSETQPYAKMRIPEGTDNPFDEVFPQDFAPLLDFYSSIGIYPKILVLGPSGSGKTRALSTINHR